MNWSMLLYGILPLLAFVLIDSFAGLKAGLISAVLMALGELVYSLVVFGEIDNITLFSFFMVGLMAFMAYRKKSDRLFMLQPVILSGALGLYLMVSYALGHPVLLEMLIKYQGPLLEMLRDSLPAPQFARMQGLLLAPPMQELFRALSLNLSYAFLAHGLITWWASVKCSKWVWLLVRGVGFYALMGLTYLITQITVMPLAP